MVTQWESHRLPGNSHIITYFSQQKSNLVATCTFLRLKSNVSTHRRELEGAEEGMIETLPLLVRKCADNVVVSVCFIITVLRI